ncbi:MAG: ABC transporter permease [Actinomycetota bacterium]
MSDIDVGPAPELRYRHKVSLMTAARGLWHSRELVLTLAERDVRARYKQMFLGFAWAFVQPLSMTLVLTIANRKGVGADLDTHGVPASLVNYLGLIVWGFFASSVLGGGLSLLANTSLLNKVRCPREAFPIASMAVATMDAAIASIALFVMFAVTGHGPRGTSFYIVPLLVVLIVFTLAVTLAIAALVVYIRDLRSVLPLALQLGLLVSLLLPLGKTQNASMLFWCALDPIAPVIDGVRRAVLFGQAPRWNLVGIAALSSSIMLVLAWNLFTKLEKGMADVL